MCKVTDIKSEVKVGYKMVAINREGKIFSSFTGQELTAGKVPLPPERCDCLSFNWSWKLTKKPLKECSFYEENYVGKTSAFLSLGDAVQCKRYHQPITGEYSLEIAKVEYDSDVFTGTYNFECVGTPIIAGDTIKSIEVL